MSQRNLVFDHSDNPGSPDSHIVRHPFELKPSQGGKGVIFAKPNDVGVLDVNYKYYQKKAYPDELIIHWGNLPRTSAVSVYIPDVMADDILALQSFTRLSTSRLEKVDEHTIRCEGGSDITYIPIPPTGRTENLTGLFTVELPKTVVKGQSFQTTIQQLEGSTRRILGSFQMTIPVGTADTLLPILSRKLSVLKHIQLSVPTTDRWHAVFNRYVTHFSDKVKALGGNPDTILPTATGLGAVLVEKVTWTLCLTLQWVVVLLLAVLIVVIGLVPMVTAAIISTILVVALLATGSFWLLRCKPDACTSFKTVMIALNVAAAILGLTYLIAGITAPNLLLTVSILCLLNLIALAGLIGKKCI